MEPAPGTANPARSWSVVAYLQGPSLKLRLEVGIARIGRRKCPSCGRLRRLVALTAFGEDQPIGYGEARCLDCAGIRRRGGR